MNIAASIKENRLRLNLSRQQLADRMNVPVDVVISWENGEIQPTLDDVSALCSIFDITADELMGKDKGGPKAVTSTASGKSESAAIGICYLCQKPIYATDNTGVYERYTRGGIRKHAVHAHCLSERKALQEENWKKDAQRNRNTTIAGVIGFIFLVIVVIVILVLIL